jgi:hyperosmotically inducible periplasmic protein
VYGRRASDPSQTLCHAIVLFQIGQLAANYLNQRNSAAARSMASLPFSSRSLKQASRHHNDCRRKTMRAIRLLIVLLVLVVAGVLGYNYWTGNGWTLRPPSTSATGVDAEKAREKGAELAREAAETTKVAAERTGEVVSEAAITAKIKSKMALDDEVKARSINVDTIGTTVTLRGTVHSERERERAVRLARETEGITQVVDKLQVVK